METQQKLAIHIRWLILKDMNDVLAIENASFPNPWTPDEFTRDLRRHDCTGQIAEVDGELVGFMVYELHKARLHLLNLAVRPDFRRRGVGAALVGKLIGKLTPQRRYRLTLDVRETNLDAQLFFAEQGLRATEILHDHYADSDEDAYRMEILASAETDVVAGGRVSLAST